MGTTESSRAALVELLERQDKVRTPAVRAALLAVPRERFVPDIAAAEGIDAVYTDRDLIVQRDSAGRATSSSSRPSIVADMLEALSLARGHRVLEVGTGTGYNAALIAHLVGDEGHVTSLEVDPELAKRAGSALERGGHRVHVVAGDGRAGFSPNAPYDRVIVTASSPAIPRTWLEQLAPDGFLEMPLRVSAEVFHPQAIVVLQRKGDWLRFVEGCGLTTAGFIPLRPGPTDTPMLHAGRLDRVNQVFGALYSQGLSKMTSSAARRLLSLILSEPRRCNLGMRIRQPALTGLQFHIAIAAPKNRFFLQLEPGRWTYGLLDLRGRGLARLGSRKGLVTSLEAFGDPDSQERLARLVRDWHELGRPGPEALAVDVSFGSNVSGMFRSRRGECVLSFRWLSDRPSARV